ncbi:MAG TPA: hypothetical protein PL110_09645 [Candidatus Eremiobacteraeota bacterium]|nr:MAG: hypothetical protein BWY64_02952 [bacterium ADurb.Bin363]HPZ08366.1 hypothetical protein [Candidatus Eremiobacteraeota bacterium]
MRRKWKWTDLQIKKLKWVLEILQELSSYKPLTLRQIYYQLVGKGLIENKVSQYNMLSGLLKWARIEGYIPWGDIEDRVRAYHDLTGWNNSGNFISASLRSFLLGYRRDLLQTQKKYLEIWIEKDALSTIFTRVAREYTVPVVVCRGFSSISFLNDFRERLGSQRKREFLMLYFGDFDPSGVEMLDAMKTTLREEMSVTGIKFKRIALLKNDIIKYHLPHNPDALKKTDTRARKHIEAYGELAVELDALRPDILEEKIKHSVERELDMKAFNKEIREHKNELALLKSKKQYIMKLLGEFS